MDIELLEQTLFVDNTWEDVIAKAKNEYPYIEPLVKHIPFKREIWVV